MRYMENLDKKIQQAMTLLLNKTMEAGDFSKETIGKLIATAVNIGMKFQTERIKQGIDIVFKELK